MYGSIRGEKKSFPFHFDLKKLFKRQRVAALASHTVSRLFHAAVLLSILVTSAVTVTPANARVEGEEYIPAKQGDLARTRRDFVHPQPRIGTRDEVNAETVSPCSAPLKLDTGQKQDKLCSRRSARCHEQEGISQATIKRR